MSEPAIADEKLAQLSRLPTSTLLLFLHNADGVLEWAYGEDWKEQTRSGSTFQDFLKLAITAVLAEVDRRVPVPA